MTRLATSFGNKRVLSARIESREGFGNQEVGGWHCGALEKRVQVACAGYAGARYVTLELTNPVSGVTHDLVQAMVHAPGEYAARVVRINPSPAPSRQRPLVELSGSWPEYEPIATGDFEPLIQ